MKRIKAHSRWIRMKEMRMRWNQSGYHRWAYVGLWRAYIYDVRECKHKQQQQQQHQNQTHLYVLSIGRYKCYRFWNCERVLIRRLWLLILLIRNAKKIYAAETDTKVMPGYFFFVLPRMLGFDTFSNKFSIIMATAVAILPGRLWWNIASCVILETSRIAKWYNWPICGLCIPAWKIMNFSKNISNMALMPWTIPNTQILPWNVPGSGKL